MSLGPISAFLARIYHLAEQIAVKSFIPVVAISSDRALTTTNIPWIFRLPEGTPIERAAQPGGGHQPCRA